jgi:glucose/arabinose dehydrogenase
MLSALALLIAPAVAAADYAVPADNPFVGVPGAAPEIYALGLRNPFRWSFDRLTGDMTIGDVGQAAWEEVDFVPAGGARGANFQWACREGNHPGPKTCTPSTPSIAPVIEYPNPDPGSSAVTGGVVVRDPGLPSFAGKYLYADFYAGHVRSATLSAGGASGDADTGLAVTQPSAFGEDAAGGVYAVSLSGGVVYRLGESGGNLTKTDAVTGLSAPMNVGAAPGDASRLFVVERAGRVIVHTGAGDSTFLDISPQVSTGGEQGMSSIAFAPDYATSGRFYVYYTDSAGSIRVDEFRRSASNPNDADEATQRNVITIPHPVDTNHYGGQMHFGPDGHLYISTGDGGGGNDIHDNAQNLATLLGKILRIDPVPAAPIAAPGPDTTAPAFRTKTKRRQRVLRLGGVVVYARCPGERCRVTLSARLHVGKRSYALKSVRKTLAKGKRARLKAKLTRRSRRALRSALRRGAKARVGVTLRARDGAGNLTRRHRATVRVKK